MYEFVIANQNHFENIKTLILEALEESPFAFSLEYSQVKNETEQWWDNYLNIYFNNNNNKLILAKNRLSQNICGCIGFCSEENEKSNRYHIATIVWFYVSKNHRNRNLGRKLLDKIFSLVRQYKRFKKMQLFVNETQKQAIKLYLKNGFKISGILKEELKIKDKFIDTLIMEKFF